MNKKILFFASFTLFFNCIYAKDKNPIIAELHGIKTQLEKCITQKKESSLALIESIHTTKEHISYSLALKELQQCCNHYSKEQCDTLEKKCSTALKQLQATQEYATYEECYHDIMYLSALLLSINEILSNIDICRSRDTMLKIICAKHEHFYNSEANTKEEICCCPLIAFLRYALTLKEDCVTDVLHAHVDLYTLIDNLWTKHTSKYKEDQQQAGQAIENYLQTIIFKNNS